MRDGQHAVLRGGSDMLWSMTLMMMAVTCVTAITLLFVPWPNAASWPFVIGSAIIHVAYNLSLVQTYSKGDLGQTYPISRVSSPVLVALGAAVFSHEALDFRALITMLPIYFYMRGKPPAYTKPQTAMALIGGVVSLIAYSIVIWAMQYGAMGIVSALRETSVVYAAIIGRIFLKEKLTILRTASCLAIAVGAACLAF